MSLGYAEKLSYREDLGGRLGAPELFDDVQELERKIDELTKLVSFAYTCKRECMIFLMLC